MSHPELSTDNVVILPFVATCRAASEPAVGRFGRLLGGCPGMQDVYQRIAKVAPTSATVLITGESGSGKDVVAEMLHEMSARAAHPFVALNCGALPRNLIEAELFGYERGAFTGAERTHRGAFERASGGTLFLDEIAEMAPDMQVRLLRVLETGRYTRVGGERELKAAARVVAATNRDPRRAVREGLLREDLLYRLGGVSDRCPAVARKGRRRGDAGRALPARAECGRRNAKAFHAGGACALPGALLARQRAGAQECGATGIHPLRRADRFRNLGHEHAASARPCLTVPVGTALAQIEKQAICLTLDACDGDKRHCAELLGISLKTLYNRLAAYHAATAAAATR